MANYPYDEVGTKLDRTFAATLNKNFDEIEDDIRQLVETVGPILDDSFDSAALAAEFEERLNNEIQKLQPDWVQFKENTTAQLAQIAVNVMEFGAKGDNETDDIEAIQSAIDYVHERGGGKVLIPTGKFVASRGFDVKENVVLIGGGKNTTVYFKQLSTPALIFHKKSYANDFRVSLLPEFDNDAFLIHSDYMEGAEDQSNGVRINLDGIELWSSKGAEGLKGTAIRICSTGIGLWNMSLKNLYIRGFQTIFKLETEGQGWVNGNIFRDITVMDFETIVETTKGAGSLGIDYNLFDHLVIQCNDESKTLFKDVDSNNVYINTEIYDMKLYQNARFGYIPSQKNTMYSSGMAKEKIASSVYTGGFYSVGRFSKGTASDAIYVTLKFHSGNDIDTEVNISKSLKVTRKHFGTRLLPKDNLTFYYKNVEDDAVDIYVKANLNLDISVFIDDAVRFTTAPFVLYPSISGLLELTNDVDKHVKANNYTRFADGTLICKGVIEGNPKTLITDDSVTGIKMLEGVNVVFPAEFSDTPTITASSRREFLPIAVGIKSITSLGFVPVLYSNVASPAMSHIYSYIAIGRSK